HDVVAVAVHGEPRDLPQPALDEIGEGTLGQAGRGDVDQLGRLRQQVRHVAAPWSRRMSLSLDLSWRSPSSRRLMTRTQGRPNSPPAKVRERVADTATLQAG